MPALIPTHLGDTAMNQFLLRLYVETRSLLDSCEGQDMAEYALASAVIAFGSVAAMSTLAAGVSNVFTHTSTVLAQHIN